MKTKLKKWGALLCAVLTLSITFTSIPVYAESVGSLEKTLDLTLVKLGIVCNETGLNQIANTLYDTAIGEVQDFEEYCTTNSLNTSDSSAYESWKEQREYQDHLLDMVMETKYRQAVEESQEVTLDFTKDDMNDAIHGGGGIRRGEQYTIDEDTVSQIHNTFQSWWSENSEYYIYRVPSVDEIDVTWFTYADSKSQLKLLVKDIENDGGLPLLLLNASGNSYMRIVPSAKYYVVNTWTSEKKSVDGYDSGWNDTYTYWVYLNGSTSHSSYSVTKLTEDNPYLSYSYGEASDAGGVIYSLNTTQFITAVSTVAKNIKIFKTTNAMKIYDSGQQIVYFTPSYSVGNITTVTYSGDYYCDNSSTYTYNTVQDDVNNIEGDVTDSIVDSTVDQSVTNIINNYYSDSSGDGSGGDSSGGDGSGGDSDSSNPFDGVFEKLMDALGNVVGLLDDIVALVLSFVGDALNAIVGMFTSVINLLTAFKDELSGLSGALGEFFPYLPEEFWTIIMASISVICGLAIIRYFMNK